MHKPQRCGAPYCFLFSSLSFTVGWKSRVPAYVTTGMALVPLAVQSGGWMNSKTSGFSFYLTLTS